MSQTRLAPNSQVSFEREFHIELLRGGMNRLLLRALPTKRDPTRVEIFFPYVQHLDSPMRFNHLTIYSDSGVGKSESHLQELLARYQECRIFRLESQGVHIGHIVAAHCIYGEDNGAAGGESMFPIER